MKQSTLSLIVCTSIFAGCGSQREPLTLVDTVEMDQMMGTWYVTHHIPYWLEKGKVATKDVYTPRPDGDIDVAFVFRRDSFESEEEQWNGKSWVVENSNNAHWKVRFWWPLTFDYLIIDRDPAYQWVVVGNNSRKYLGPPEQPRSGAGHLMASATRTVEIAGPSIDANELQSASG
jgi:apolipoprotein D and lipocalin family protein